MATNTGEEHPSRPTEANAPADSSRHAIATCRDDCQKLKDLIIQKDASTMVVVMASGNQASEDKPSTVSMHPLLAAAACRGNLEELKFLLNRGPLPHQEFRDQVEAYYPGYSSNRSLAMQLTATNIEEGMNASSVLEGVTVEGDTALHLLAANGRGDNSTNCANLIYGEDKSFLCKQNYNGDTPLHCAARTGNSQMVSHLIDLARGENRVEDLLRKENLSKETALHEAVRIGDNHIVKELMRADRELARFPEAGPSPLYLAILLGKDNIAKILHDESKDNVLSYTGPGGQNALHAAVHRSEEMVSRLLIWNKGLTSEVDCNGSTPFHFSPIWMVFEANPATLYQQDNSGMFPIHVAASAGGVKMITRLIEYHPSSAGLRDRRGRTFLHTAAEESRWRVVQFACRTPSLAWILNMQDTDGNTALHLAVQTECLRSFSYLLGNPLVHLNLVNKKGQAPLDISRLKIHPGIVFYESTEVVIERALSICGAKHAIIRLDHRFKEALTKPHDARRKIVEDLKDSTQTLCIGSVLMTTMAFGAIFAVPGGYRDDDHPNGGTPTLSGRYAFDAFMMANALAFICSSVATIGLVISGLPIIDLKSRKSYFMSSVYFVNNSVTSLSAAFALGVYMVLAPVAHKTAVAISVMSPLAATYTSVKFSLKWGLLARPLYSKIGLINLLMEITRTIAIALLVQCWPLLITFCWPAIARNH